MQHQICNEWSHAKNKDKSASTPYAVYLCKFILRTLCAFCITVHPLLSTATLYDFRKSERNTSNKSFSFFPFISLQIKNKYSICTQDKMKNNVYTSHAVCLSVYMVSRCTVIAGNRSFLRGISTLELFYIIEEM